MPESAAAETQAVKLSESAVVVPDMTQSTPLLDQQIKDSGRDLAVILLSLQSTLRRFVHVDEQIAGRFEVVVEEGSPRGDLYELEQKTYHQVVDRHSNQIIMVFESLMEASLSTSTGLWDDYRFTGVSEVSIAPDEQSVIVKYHDGLVETVPLPK